MKNLAVKAYLKGKALANNEKGAMSLEWLGIAALLIMVIAIISSYLGKNKSTITTIISDILKQIGKMV